MLESASILIADDEETFLLSTADLLRREGYRCETAFDGAAAADALRRKRFDVVIADIKMPGNGRLELVRELAGRSDGSQVILITGYPSLDSAIESVKLPVIAYLVKPVEFKEVLAYVQAAVRDSRVRQTVARMRRRLEGWTEELGSTEELARLTEPGERLPTEAFVAQTLRNVVACLGDLGRLTDALGGNRARAEACQVLDCPRYAELRQVIGEAIETLEKTKSSFRSSDLAALRRKLELVLRASEARP